MQAAVRPELTAADFGSPQSVLESNGSADSGMLFSNSSSIPQSSMFLGCLSKTSKSVCALRHADPGLDVHLKELPTSCFERVALSGCEP